MNVHQQRLLLATTSADKIRELREILADLPVQMLTPPDIGLALEVEETGTTFRENADIKARAYWGATGMACLAEDSGFEVDALDDGPGVLSARWEGTDYERKNRLIVERLRGLEGQARRCRYVCAATFIDPGGKIHRASGRLVGRVAQEPSGQGGFGYDPIFELPKPGRTLAEMAPGEKNALSHRARAIRAIRPAIERALLAP